MCQVVIPATRVLSPTRITKTNSSEYARYSDRANQDYSPYTTVDAGDDNTFGFAGANGGGGNSGNFVSYNKPLGTPPKDTPYGSIDFIINEALNQDWTERGSPPNPLIAAAALVSGTEISNDSSFPWCTAFLSYALEKAGIENLRNSSSQSYLRYGNPVDWRILENIRINDIVVFTRKSSSSKGHTAFVRGFDPASNSLIVCGGNQGNKVKESKFPISGSELYVNQIRRNWTIPTEFDKPIAGPAG